MGVEFSDVLRFINPYKRVRLINAFDSFNLILWQAMKSEKAFEWVLLNLERLRVETV